MSHLISQHLICTCTDASAPYIDTVMVFRPETSKSWGGFGFYGAARVFHLYIGEAASHVQVCEVQVHNTERMGCSEADVITAVLHPETGRAYKINGRAKTGKEVRVRHKMLLKLLLYKNDAKIFLMLCSGSWPSFVCSSLTPTAVFLAVSVNYVAYFVTLCCIF